MNQTTSTNATEAQKSWVPMIAIAGQRALCCHLHCRPQISSPRHSCRSVSWRFRPLDEMMISWSNRPEFGTHVNGTPSGFTGRKRRYIKCLGPNRSVTGDEFCPAVETTCSGRDPERLKVRAPANHHGDSMMPCRLLTGTLALSGLCVPRDAQRPRSNAADDSHLCEASL
jgi:hypothetical protein